MTNRTHTEYNAKGEKRGLELQSITSNVKSAGPFESTVMMTHNYSSHPYSLLSATTTFLTLPHLYVGEDSLPLAYTRYSSKLPQEQTECKSLMSIHYPRKGYNLTLSVMHCWISAPEDTTV